MTVMAVILLIAGSLILREWNMYEPYAQFSGKQGFVVWYEGDVRSALENNAAEVYSTYRTLFYNDLSDSCVYPDWVVEHWKPRLKSGRWLQGDSTENEIVIGGNTGSLKTGDLLTKNCSTPDGESIEVVFRVVGILADGTKLLNGSDSLNSDQKGYSSCYRAITDTDLYVLMTKNTADRLGLEQIEAMAHVVTFPNRMEEEAFEALYNELGRTTDAWLYDLEEFSADSVALLQNQILTYVPVLLFGIVLALTGVYAAAHINLKMGMKHHTIFMLVGATPFQRLRILLTEVFVNTLLSVMLFGFFCLLLDMSGLKGQLVIEYSWELGAAEAIYYLFNVLVSILFYIHAWKNISPKEALLQQK
jgi:hypothetical protein